jgi:hypothetical protein
MYTVTKSIETEWNFMRGFEFYLHTFINPIGQLDEIFK